MVKTCATTPSTRAIVSTIFLPALTDDFEAARPAASAQTGHFRRVGSLMQATKLAPPYKNSWPNSGYIPRRRQPKGPVVFRPKIISAEHTAPRSAANRTAALPDLTPIPTGVTRAPCTHLARSCSPSSQATPAIGVGQTCSVRKSITSRTLKSCRLPRNHNAPRIGPRRQELSVCRSKYVPSCPTWQAPS